MASVNTSFYSQLKSQNKGIGGLVSGLDTDSIIEQLTMGTRSKLARELQQKTLLSWKTTEYRTIANDLRTFQSKYLSGAAGSNQNPYIRPAANAGFAEIRVTKAAL